MHEKRIYPRGAAVAIGLLLFVLIAAAPAAAATWDVYPSDDLKNIVKNQIAAGDTVIVHAGTYSLDATGLQITKPDVTLRGEDREASIIEFSPTSSIEIGGDYSANNCTVDNLTVVGLRTIGFNAGSDNSVVKNCILKHIPSGSSAGIGINSPNCTIEGNVIDRPYNAINQASAVNIPFTFRNNIIANTTDVYSAIRTGTSAGVIIENNTILKSCKGGITIYKGANATIVGNTVSSQGKGIWAYQPVGQNTIYSNQFSDNDGGNVVASTPLAAQNWVSPGAVTYTYDGRTHTGHIGNYYDDYTGTDADGDGIGDTRFELPSGLGTDTAPLAATLDQYAFGGEPGPGGDAPAANFTANVTSGDAPLAVQFTDTSANTPTAWAWDFEDDGTVDSTEQNPVHTYDATGTYTVNLTVTNDFGSDTMTKEDFIAVTVLEVTPFPNPAGGTFPAPTDPNGDGLYEDLDGNGWIGFNDVIVCYDNLGAIDAGTYGPASLFDYDGNGWIGFNDVIGLFEMV